MRASPFERGSDVAARVWGCGGGEAMPAHIQADMDDRYLQMDINMGNEMGGIWNGDVLLQLCSHLGSDEPGGGECVRRER